MPSLSSVEYAELAALLYDRLGEAELADRYVSAGLRAVAAEDASWHASCADTRAKADLLRRQTGAVAPGPGVPDNLPDGSFVGDAEAASKRVDLLTLRLAMQVAGDLNRDGLDSTLGMLSALASTYRFSRETAGACTERLLKSLATLLAGERDDACDMVLLLEAI